MDIDTALNCAFTLPTPDSTFSEGNLNRFNPFKTTGDVPQFRLNSAYCVTNDDTLFLFGGFDEDDRLDGNVYLLNLKTWEWSKRSHRSHRVYREGHSCTYIGNNIILIVGGELGSDEEYESEFSDCQILFYNIVEDRFFQPEPSKAGYPSGRSRHAICITPDMTKLFISGGIDKNNTSLPIDDLYCLDLTNFTWAGPIEFVTRFDHFITYHDNKIYSFGGLTQDMNHVNQISWIDLDTNMIGEIKLKDVPRQMGGDHIYLSANNYNSSVILNVLIPLWDSHLTDDQRAASIVTFDLIKLRWNMVVVGDYPLKGIYWRHSFISYNQLYLLGSSSNSETQLSEIIKIELSNFGVAKKDATHNKGNNNFIMDFGKMLKDEEFTDFEIFGNDYETKGSIKAHKAILLARWPHFKRVISSGMSESSTNTMMIPEPTSCLRGLVTFLYTNELDPEITNTIEDYTGLLQLSNVYEMDDLKGICLEKIYRSMNLQNLIFIWKKSLLANELILQSNCCKYIFENWGYVIKTQDFQKLDKESMMKLFESMDENSKIVSSNTTTKDRQYDLDDDGILVEEGTSLTSLHSGLFTRLSSPTQRP